MVYNGEVIGYKVDFWISHPGGSYIFCSADMIDGALADSVSNKEWFPVKVKVVDNNYITEYDEKGIITCVEVTEKRGLDKIVRAWTKALEERKKFGKRSIDIGWSLLRFLQQYGIKVPYSDEAIAREECLEIRFLGGMGAWSGSDEDICDADRLDPKVKKQVFNAIRDFKDSRSDYLRGVDINELITGEKAWSYIGIIPTTIGEYKVEGSLK